MSCMTIQVVKNELKYLYLVSDRALTACTVNVLQRDPRMLAHRPENPVLPMKNIRSIKFNDIPVVHYTNTIIRDDRP
jgi:hypothetical protein